MGTAYVVAVLDSRIAHADPACAYRHCDQLEQHAHHNSYLLEWSNPDTLAGGLRGELRDIQDWSPCDCFVAPPATTRQPASTCTHLYDP